MVEGLGGRKAVSYDDGDRKRTTGLAQRSRSEGTPPSPTATGRRGHADEGLGEPGNGITAQYGNGVKQKMPGANSQQKREGSQSNRAVRGGRGWKGWRLLGVLSLCALLAGGSQLDDHSTRGRGGRNNGLENRTGAAGRRDRCSGAGWPEELCGRAPPSSRMCPIDTGGAHEGSAISADGAGTAAEGTTPPGGAGARGGGGRVREKGSGGDGRPPDGERPGAADGDGRSRTKLRAAMSETFLVYAANVGGLHLTGRSEGAAAGRRVGGALSKSFLGGSKWDRIADLAKQTNKDEQISKRYGLLIFTETQTRANEVEYTKQMFSELGYNSVIVRGVQGRGLTRAREERAGVVVAWDKKSLTVIKGPSGQHRPVVTGRVTHMRFRVHGADPHGAGGIRGGGEKLRMVGGEWRPLGSRDGAAPTGGYEHDLDLLACYMPQRRGTKRALAEAKRAWTELVDKVGELAGHGRLLIAGDLNAESMADMQRRGAKPTGSDDSFASLEQDALVTGLGPRDGAGWTSLRNQGTENELRNRIDHMLAGPVWAARVLSTAVVDGIEVCAGHGHCHRALVSEVSRERHEALHEPDWRPAGVTLCGEADGRPEQRCGGSYRDHLADLYESALRRARAQAGLSTPRVPESATRRGIIRVCSLDRRGLDDGCPDHCELPPTTATCVRAGGRGLLSNPFEVRDARGNGDAGRVRSDVRGAHERLLTALAAQGGGQGGRQDGLAVGIAGVERDAGASPGLYVRAGMVTAQSELLRWRLICGLDTHLRQGTDVWLAADETSDTARVSSIGTMVGANGGCDLGRVPRRETDTTEARHWDALEQDLDAGVRIETMQAAMLKAMALAADQDTDVGKGGAGRGHAGNKATWVKAVANRLDKIQDQPTTDDGWRLFLPAPKDLVNGAPPVYQHHNMDSDLLKMIQRVYSRGAEIMMLNQLHGGPQTTAENEERERTRRDRDAETRKNEEAARAFLQRETGEAGAMPEGATARGQTEASTPPVLRVTRQSSGERAMPAGLGAEGRLTRQEFNLAKRRWTGEVEAIKTALSAVDAGEAHRRQTDNYIRTLERAESRGGHRALERAVYQVVENHNLAREGHVKVRGSGLEVVREGDRADGRLLSEPQAVLDAVREFGVRI